MCRYDGIEFAPSSDFDTLPVDIVNVSFSDSLGKLWFGFNNGEVWAYDGNYFTPYIIEKDRSFSISGIHADVDRFLRSLLAACPLSFHRLSEAVAFAIHLRDVTVVC